MPINAGEMLNSGKKAAIKYGKSMMTLSSIAKGIGLFIGGDYLGEKVEKLTRPKSKSALQRYMYKKPTDREQLKQLGKTVAIGFVPVIGDFASGVYNGYVTSRTLKRKMRKKNEEKRG